MSFEVDITLARGGRQMAVGFAAGAGLTAILGPSGVGKTSTLDAIAGLLTPTQGRIVVSGRVLFDRAAGIDLRPEARACGYLFQDLRLFPHLTVKANLAYGQRLVAPDRRWIATDEVCDLLGIGALLGRMPATLSGGEAQRVALGRALLGGPRFLLLDEPLSSLDPARREEIMGLIERIRDSLGLPILYVSHDRAEVERLAATVVHLAA
jgi:molybdate transport system ATP-binding protein